MVGMAPELLVELPADSSILAADIVAPILAEPAMSPTDAVAALATLGEQGSSRRGRGVFYTPADVCELLTRDNIDPLVTSPRPEPGTRGPVRVLDPTCGAGAFLRAAARRLNEVDAADGVGQARVCGVDADPVAVECSRMLLALDARAGHPLADQGPTHRAIARNVVLGDAIRQAAWDEWFPEVMEQGGFAVVLANPPWVRATAGESGAAALLTATTGNAYAYVVERALAACAPGARMGAVIPVSSLCTDAFAPLRGFWDAACTDVWAASFDAVPQTLFPGTVQRLALVSVRVRHVGAASTPARWRVTRYHKWRRAERDTLLEQLSYVERPPQHIGGSVAKVGTSVERDMLERLFAHRPAGRLFTRRVGANRFFYKRRWSYYLLFTDFCPPIYHADGSEREPSEFKSVDVVGEIDARALLAAFASGTFHWFFTVFSDNRNVNRRELSAFPFPDLAPVDAGELVCLADELMVALRASSEIRTCTYASIGTIHNTYFRQAQTKPVLDRIDAVLARCYGFTEQELRFIVDFEREFRVPAAGSDVGADDVHHDGLTREQQRRERRAQHVRQAEAQPH
jgi:hypothetical protein